jgi:hypothetical protein
VLLRSAPRLSVAALLCSSTLSGRSNAPLRCSGVLLWRSGARLLTTAASRRAHGVGEAYVNLQAALGGEIM